MDDIMKIIKFLEKSGLLIKGVSETIKRKRKSKGQKSEFLGILVGTLVAGLLGNLLTRKGVKAKIHGGKVMRAGK